MNVLDRLLASARSNSLGRLGDRHGLAREDLAHLLTRMVPALAASMKERSETCASGDWIERAVADAAQLPHLEHPAFFAASDRVAQVNEILRQVLGSKNMSRALATRLAVDTGIEAGVIKRLLPLTAMAMLRALSEQAAAGSGRGLSVKSSGLGVAFGEMIGAESGGAMIGKSFSLRRSLFNG